MAGPADEDSSEPRALLAEIATRLFTFRAAGHDRPRGMRSLPRVLMKLAGCSPQRSAAEVDAWSRGPTARDYPVPDRPEGHDHYGDRV